MKVIYLDIETQQLPFGKIPMKDIKVAVAGTLCDGEFLTWDDNYIEELVTYLKTADKVVGHNIFSFDYSVIGNYFQYPEVVLGAKGTGLRGKTFDTMSEFAKIVGHGNPRGHLMALENMCVHTFGMQKPHDGKLIPQMWQDGKHDEVISYLRNDLEMTEKFYLAGCAGTMIKYEDKVYGKSQGEKEIFVKW